MKEELGTWGAVVGAAVLACLFAGLVLAIYPGWGTIYEALVGAGLQWSTFWSAASAVGTFAAAGAAVWIALRQSSLQSKQEIKVAHLYAARISVRLHKVASSLRSQTGAYGFPLDGSERSQQLQAFDEMLLWLSSPRFEPTTQVLVALVPMPNNCAHKIARAYDILRDLEAEICHPNTEDFFKALTGKGRQKLLNQWSERMDEASELLFLGAEECRRASLVGAPRPSREELYGDPG